VYQTQVKPKGCSADEELVEVLTAISVVSKRLARKLSLLAGQSKSTEGEKQMSKMSEMPATIAELRKCAAAISDAANWLAKQFSGNEPEPETVLAEPVLTLEAVRAVLADKSRAGFTAQIRSLLQKYGADKLSGVDPANYKALLADVEGLTDVT